MDNTTDLEKLKTMIQNDNNISDNYKKIINKISYESLLTVYTNISNSKNLNFMELFDMLSSIMIFVENTKINGKKIDSDTKKHIVLHLGKCFITHNVKDEQFLELYDKHADDMIEKIIYSSVFLNVGNTVKHKCCLF